METIRLLFSQKSKWHKRLGWCSITISPSELGSRHDHSPSADYVLACSQKVSSNAQTRTANTGGNQAPWMESSENSLRSR